MSWATGGILFCLWLIVMYVLLAVLGFVKRGDSDQWNDFTEHQWKDLRRMDLRRRLEDRARNERAGIRQ